MKKGEHDDLKRRDRDILIKYTEVIRKYGDLATRLPKQFFYDEVAEAFYISPRRAAFIINKMLKNKQ